MANETREAKRKRKAAAKRAANERAAAIRAGQIPSHLRRSRAAQTAAPSRGGGSTRAVFLAPGESAARPSHRIVQAVPAAPVRALVPPSSSPLRDHPLRPHEK
ncbi:hypothetical protein LO771_27285 [Streptacidiphilus sp. ASG 303]|uniref:hypothetical protein n=1 Tax=Streptacidiphilus sp. ASG 303 TaxID=2896847 RepID=UPI001E587EEA|nr:hypothetical protein [Streptacidiphilus sp. ASG 303]MCD0485987.1 hypothetical protein [Streptacidiphilus sp. ASG 303]